MNSTNSDARATTAPLLPHTAIAHDWFQGYHGAERVVEAMRTGLFSTTNQPDIFTFQAAKELLPLGLAAAIVQQSGVANLPGIRQRGENPGRWRYLLPYMPRYFSRLDLRPYDLVISSSHACAVNVRPRPDVVHICYCHTPMRYAWMPETDERLDGLSGLALRAFRNYLRRTDLAASTRPDGYVANSRAVAERVERFYGREATVIYPPVDVDDFDATLAEDPRLFVWAHRLVAYKKPELVAEAFRGTPYRLVMVGVGPLEASLRARAPNNVEIRGWLPRGELASLYASATGFVHVGEEDFGITMVEALASGTPVIAVDRGGARDIVRPGRDGILLEQAELEQLREAIRRVAESNWNRADLAARAQEFSRARFIQRFGDYLAAHKR